MIDIHAHILPGVDDGPESLDRSLEMLSRGVKDGIRGVVCTSHVLDVLDEKVEEEFIRKFEELKAGAEKMGLNVSLWLGSEIHCQARFDMRFKVATFNNNRKYALLELPLVNYPVNAEDIFFTLRLEGITPILAHPERNTVIMQKPEIVYALIQRGVLMQVNSDSLTGNFGKKVKRVAFQMLDHRMVHFIATDCHSPKNRPMRLSKAYTIVRRRYGEKEAEKLFCRNPYKAVIGEEISSPPPLSFNKKKGSSGRVAKRNFFRMR